MDYFMIVRITKLRRSTVPITYPSWIFTRNYEDKIVADIE